MRGSEATSLPTPRAVQLLAKIDLVAAGFSEIAIYVWGQIGKICALSAAHLACPLSPGPSSLASALNGDRIRAIPDAIPGRRCGRHRRCCHRTEGCRPRSQDDDVIVVTAPARWAIENGAEEGPSTRCARSGHHSTCLPCRACHERAREAGESSGAEERTRTFMGLRPLAPEARSHLINPATE
jgi:hypothetical protein